MHCTKKRRRLDGTLWLGLWSVMVVLVILGIVL